MYNLFPKQTLYDRKYPIVAELREGPQSYELRLMGTRDGKRCYCVTVLDVHTYMSGDAFRAMLAQAIRRLETELDRLPIREAMEAATALMQSVWETN